MSSLTWFTVLVAAVAAERVAELVVSQRHLQWARSRGGVETGAGHYPPMVALHTALLGGCLLEAWLSGRTPISGLWQAALAVVLAAQALRWWCIATLGPQWNTRIVVVPGLPLVRRGPYRLIRHPNYVAVVAEGVALPLVHTAWITAVVFTALNAALLTVRIRAENTALTAAPTAQDAL